MQPKMLVTALLFAFPAYALTPLKEDFVEKNPHKPKTIIATLSDELEALLKVTTQANNILKSKNVRDFNNSTKVAPAQTTPTDKISSEIHKSPVPNLLQTKKEEAIMPDVPGSLTTINKTLKLIKRAVNNDAKEIHQLWNSLEARMEDSAALQAELAQQPKLNNSEKMLVLRYVKVMEKAEQDAATRLNGAKVKLSRQYDKLAKVLPEDGSCTELKKLMGMLAQALREQTPSMMLTKRNDAVPTSKQAFSAEAKSAAAGNSSFFGKIKAALAAVLHPAPKKGITKKK